MTTGAIASDGRGLITAGLTICSGDTLGPMLAGVLAATVGYRPMFRLMADIAFIRTVLFYLVSARGSRRPQGRQTPDA